MKGQYIQFFTKSKTNSNFHLLVEDTGNTAPLDGRFSLSTCCDVATKLCREHGYKGFRVMIEKQVKHKDGDYKTKHYLTDCWKVFPNTVEC